MTNAILSATCTILFFAGCRPQARTEDQDVTPGLRFTDVTHLAGLASFRHENGAFGQRLFPETMSGSLAFIDSNGDGWQDLLVVGGGTWRGANDVPAVRLFENRGDGTFRDVTVQRGLDAIRAYGMGLAVADYDNDGDDDFFMAGVFRDLLFRNDVSPNGRRFTEIAEVAGVAGDSSWGSSAVFFDADRDGWLDLFVGNYVQWSPETDLWCMSGRRKAYCTPEVYTGVAPFFYRGNGDGTFTEQSVEAGFGFAEGKTLGVATLDYDGDGWMDLAVANDTEPDLLYHNNGDGTFTELGKAAGTAYDDRGHARAGMGIAVGVVDTTGRPTIFVTNFSNEMIGVYRYEGNGLFSDRAAASGIGAASRRTLAFGTFLFDVELDGDLDLFVANGHITPEVDEDDDDVTYRQTPHLFLNDGRGSFGDVAPGLDGPLTRPMLGRGAAFADIDLDGDLDVAIAENAGSVRLLRNETRVDGMGPSFLRISLGGGAGKPTAIGASVTIHGGGIRQTRVVHSGSSYQSQSELPLTFGLGSVRAVDSLIIIWPDGQKDIYQDVPVDQALHFEQTERVPSDFPMMAGTNR